MRRLLYAAAFGLASVFLLGSLAGGAQDFSGEAVNQPAAEEKVGERPYEMEGRREARRPLVDFEDLSGWKVAGYDGGRATLYRSREEQMWGDYVAKITHWGATRRGRVEISPPEPIEIPDEFSAVNIWLYGDNWGWVHYPSLTRASLFIRLLDAEGETHEINMGVINAKYWFLAHRSLAGKGSQSPNYSSSGDGRIDFPAKLVSIVVSPCADKEPRSIYLDSLSFYREERKPLTFQERTEKLPFPTTEDTILPSVKHDYTNAAVARGDEYVFEYRGNDCHLEYVYSPATGTLGDVEVVYDGERKFKPMSGGGIEFDVGGKRLGPEEKGIRRELVSAEFRDGALTTEWLLKADSAELPFTLSFRIKGKTLIVGASAKGGSATRFVIGRAEGLRDAKLVKVPYLTFGQREPRVVCGGGVFVFGLLDWYNSDASRLYSRVQTRPDGSAYYNGGSEYVPRTDGVRNDLRERLFLTVSGDFQEVLPNVPNPPSPMRETASHYLWRNVGQIQPELCRKYKAYGIDWFMANHHEVVWRDGGESFTLRLKAAPRNVGDARLEEYSALLRELGYRFGLYTNYSDYAPVNENWDEDKVSLLPNGDWQRAWPRNYALKPTYAREFEAYFAPRIHEKFGTSAGYCDVHTALIPWDRTDYDARVPGAGMFRPVFESFGELLWKETKFQNGPVFSEGRMHWLYAGLADGNYAQIVSPAPYKEPQLVDFDLLKIHPLETDFGMGMPSMFYEGSTDWRKESDFHSPFFDRFVAATIAYGHIGYLAAEWGFAGTLKSYFLLQQLQRLYATDTVAEIEYDRQGKLVSTSEAVASDAYKNGRVFVRYTRGLQVFVNYNEESDWAIRLDGEMHVLPPFGFYATDGRRFVEYSKMVGGKRVEFVNSPEYVYIDTRGAFVRLPEMAARGAVVFKKENERVWCLIPATACEDFCLYTGRLMPAISVAEVKITAVGESGEELGEVQPRTARGGLSFPQTSGAIKYRVEFREEPEKSPAGLRLSLKGAEWEVGIGETLPVEATVWNFSRSLVTDLTLRVCLEGKEDSAQEKQVKAGVAPQSGLRSDFVFKMPADAMGKDRIWIRGEAKAKIGGTKTTASAWLDFQPVPAMEINFLPKEAIEARPGQKVEFRVEVTSHLRWDYSSTIEVASLSPRRRILARDQFLLKRGMPREVAFIVVAPDRDEVGEVAVTVNTGKARYEEKLRLEATTAPEKGYRLSDLVPEPVWGYCYRGEEEVAGDVSSGATFVFGENSCGGIGREGHFAHPPYIGGVGYTFGRFAVALPEERVFLKFSIGLRDGSASQDGVVFRIAAEGQGKERRVVFEKHWQKTEWSEESVDLSEFAGAKTTLTLITDVGPGDNSNSDWACWGEPRIVLTSKVMRLRLRALHNAGGRQRGGFRYIESGIRKMDVIGIAGEVH